jgi:hypothetical protein
MNNYLNIIWELSLKNEKAQEYIDLCNSALMRDLADGYIEKHHIYPESLCENNEQKKDKDNLVRLSYREHFIAHQLLIDIFDNTYIKRKMQKALSMMLVDRLGNRILTSDEYEIARKANSESKKGVKLPPFTEEHLKNMSLSRKDKPNGRKGLPNGRKGKPLTENQIAEYENRIGNWISPMDGKKHSEESKKKMSKSGKGKKKSENHIKNISKSLIGRSFSAEHLTNMSISAKKKPKVICEHCGISCIKSNHTRWHGDKCKQRKENV